MDFVLGALLVLLSLVLISSLSARLNDSLSCGVLPALVLGTLLAAIVLGMLTQSGGLTHQVHADLQAVHARLAAAGELSESSRNEVHIVPLSPASATRLHTGSPLDKRSQLRP